jgi:carbonic anhydrase
MKSSWIEDKRRNVMDKQQKPRSKIPAWPSIGRATASSTAERHEKAHHGKFATAINCMDGRVQLPVINWLMENLSVDYVDMITEPGPDRILAEGTAAAQDSIRARVLISVNKHGSDTILVAAHEDCAGNPVTRAQHETHVRQSVIRILSWKLPVKRVFGAWIGEDWKVEIIEASR